MEISKKYLESNKVTLFEGDTLDLLKQIPDKSAMLVVTSPPYNLGKEYETRQDLDKYRDFQEKVIKECVRILKDEGSICWEVGNYVNDGEIVPLDILLYPIFTKFGLKLRNRIVWHFEHGLHSSKRFSGRYETINWFTKTDNYYFNLDPVRVPQKYPGKLHYKGPKKGLPSGNPLGKNPSDVWKLPDVDVWELPNVKSNHPEKTVHPCQYPVELIERLVLSMTHENDLVFDPFIGVGSTAIAAIKNNRRVAGADLMKKYLDIAEDRLKDLENGTIKLRTMGQPVHVPDPKSKLVINPFSKKS